MAILLQGLQGLPLKIGAAIILAMTTAHLGPEGRQRLQQRKMILSAASARVCGRKRTISPFKARTKTPQEHTMRCRIKLDVPSRSPAAQPLL